MPVHNWKYAPIVRRATAALRDGAIGTLRRVEIDTRRLRDCAVEDPERPNWRRDPAVAGGGILMDHGWHAVYLALHWFGEAPGEVRASLHRPTPSAVEDEAAVTIAFPSGEASIALSWNADVRRNTMRLVGEAGEILVGDDTLVLPGESVAYARGLSSGSHHEDWFAALCPTSRPASGIPRSRAPRSRRPRPPWTSFSGRITGTTCRPGCYSQKTMGLLRETAREFRGLQYLRAAKRLYDDKPLQCSLYVTDQCNLDCAYCTEYDNTQPHPSLDDLTKWLTKIRDLGRCASRSSAASRSCIPTSSRWCAARAASAWRPA